MKHEIKMLIEEWWCWFFLMESPSLIEAETLLGQAVNKCSERNQIGGMK